MLNFSAIPTDAPLCVIIGAGQQTWPGWIATRGDELNVLRLVTYQ